MRHSCVVFWQRRVHTKVDLCTVCVALVHVMIGSAEQKGSAAHPPDVVVDEV
jgi:hypothetical protein